MRRVRQDEGNPEINITPLIDVVFVILIGFILIAPLLEMDRIQLADAGSDAVGVEAKPSPLQINVRKDNTILFNTKEVSIDELKIYLIDERARHPEERPKLMQDRQAYFGTYQAVKNVLAEVGYDELDIILNPCKE